MRDRQRRTRAAANAQNFVLNLARQCGNRLWCQLLLIPLIQRPLKVRHQQNMTFVERTHRLACRNTGLNQFIRHRLTGGVFRIAFQPIGVVQQAVTEHRLGFRIGH
ncbi:hypothetical protein D3C81_1758000 [compost metagenome]